MSPGPRPASVPSGILIHRSVTGRSRTGHFTSTRPDGPATGTGRSDRLSSISDSQYPLTDLVWGRDIKLWWSTYGRFTVSGKGEGCGEGLYPSQQRIVSGTREGAMPLSRKNANYMQNNWCIMLCRPTFVISTWNNCTFKTSWRSCSSSSRLEPGDCCLFPGDSQEFWETWDTGFEVMFIVLCRLNCISWLDRYGRDPYFLTSIYDLLMAYQA